MRTITIPDGTRIYYKDWGSGVPVVFSHGWPLSSDSWEDQMLFLAARGHRCIAHDRRGHGRSSQPWNGNDMDTYADDLAALIEALDLRGVTLVGFSTGGGEVARYIGRHGTARVARIALVSAVPPLMLKTPANPEGLPIEVFDDIRKGVLADRSQFFRDVSGPFFGADFSPDLARFDRPTLIVHGDDDQIVPIVAAALKSSKLVKDATLKIYEGAPHGLTATHKDGSTRICWRS